MSLRSCVVIPGYNAAATIGPLVQQIKRLGLDAVVVNDGSTDQTARVATDAGALVISHVSNQGKGSALRTAFAYALQAGYDAVVTMDSDGQHDPAEIPQLLHNAERQPSAVVVGERRMSGVMPPVRRWTNRFLSWLTSRLTRQRIPDSQCGFRVIHRRVLETVTLSTSHFEIETELLLAAARSGWVITSVPIKTIYNNHTSHIHPIWDTLRLSGLVVRYLFGMRAGRLRR